MHIESRHLLIASIAGLALVFLLAGCKTSLFGDGGDSGKNEVDAAFADLSIPAPTKRTETKPMLMVHMMPWFQAPPVSKSFGWHWHMGYYEPDELDANGDAQIATHYYPLTGPYDSSDPAVLEYQTMLMKLSGIDGVIIDWYGTDNILDYAKNQTNSLAIVAAVKKAGLKFAICYEDQSIGKAIEAGKLTQADAVAHAKTIFTWLDQNWFNDPAYVHIDGKPLLLDFGPQYFTSSDQWEQLFAGLSQRPLFIGLDSHMEFYTDGSYPWPPMWASSAGTLSLSRLVQYLNDYYRTQNDKAHMVASAWPRFHDIYSEAHVGPSYGYLDDHNGETFHLTLEAATRAKPDIIQVATWNDFGEGTVVEPNKVYGNRDLLTLQKLRLGFDPTFAFGPNDIPIALKAYQLRKSGAAGSRLDALFQAAAQGDVNGFRSIASELGLDK